MEMGGLEVFHSQFFIIMPPTLIRDHYLVIYKIDLSYLSPLGTLSFTFNFFSIVTIANIGTLKTNTQCKTIYFVTHLRLPNVC